MELKAKVSLLLCLLAFGSKGDVIRINLTSDVGKVLKVKTDTTSTFVMNLMVTPKSDLNLTALVSPPENNRQPPVWLECPDYINDSCDTLSTGKSTKELNFRIVAFPTDNEKITLFEPVKFMVRSLVKGSKLQGGDLRVLVIDKRRESLQYLVMGTRVFSTMLHR